MTEAVLLLEIGMHTCTMQKDQRDWRLTVCILSKSRDVNEDKSGQKDKQVADEM